MLEYFPENPALQFVLVVEKFPNDSRGLVQMATSSGDTVPLTRRGWPRQLRYFRGCVYRSVDLVQTGIVVDAVLQAKPIAIVGR